MLEKKEVSEAIKNAELETQKLRVFTNKLNELKSRLKYADDERLPNELTLREELIIEANAYNFVLQDKQQDEVHGQGQKQEDVNDTDSSN